MVTCLKCTRFVTQTEFGWCCECLNFVGLMPGNMAPQLPSQPPNHYNIIPSYPPAAAPTPSIFQALPANPTTPAANLAQCAGSNAHIRNIRKSKRTKNPAPTPYSRNPKPSVSATLTESPMRMFKCGISFFQDKKQKKTGIMSYMRQIDTSLPNLYETLQHQLWQLFLPELLRKELVEGLPKSPIGRTSLSHNKSVLDPQTLLLLVKQSTIKKPVQIDLIYEDNGEDTDTIPETETPAATERSLRSQQSSATFRIPSPLESQIVPRQTSHITSRRHNEDQASTPTAVAARPTKNSWALGGIAGTVPARGSASLSTHMNYLGRPLATTTPLTVKVDHNTLVGQGSMRRAFSAEVKTEGRNGGPPRITHWVAKVRYHNEYPDIKLHATNARMYEAAGHLLQAYQAVINRCSSNLLTGVLREKAKAFKLVRHCVIFIGEEHLPAQVYFLEACLQGEYVKYLSNVNFSVTGRQPGMDLDNLSIMNAFTHWSYVISNGASLVCDLQGVGSTITDPQIIDRDYVRWADGNNASKGIQNFLENHICNDVCRALKLGPPSDIVPEVTNPTPLQRSVQSHVAQGLGGPSQAAGFPTGSRAMTEIRSNSGICANPAPSHSSIGNLPRSEFLTFYCSKLVNSVKITLI
ncbi:alphaK A2 [Puccinia graminis f. sp. tritici CRL 75-36-700-3]|uniref:AlphaK A2 n=1 Tax=Puccinia graminis f. sp. tritici (strain CRL 75-36-700-3 / race SCCL) TaxID=418459 RepID=E3L161_PUCGT|nr:alphaK A2 [Puccinia graminis f. sp. tritici CRL 75-36-700-3]EFP90335.2 alphaK A2 [Puccinia graminis f. sp. tritici CRL 75-36-700-3]